MIQVRSDSPAGVMNTMSMIWILYGVTCIMSLMRPGRASIFQKKQVAKLQLAAAALRVVDETLALVSQVKIVMGRIREISIFTPSVALEQVG
jgi:hypothetical protein